MVTMMLTTSSVRFLREVCSAITQAACEFQTLTHVAEIIARAFGQEEVQVEINSTTHNDPGPRPPVVVSTYHQGNGGAVSNAAASPSDRGGTLKICRAIRENEGVSVRTRWTREGASIASDRHAMFLLVVDHVADELRHRQAWRDIGSREILPGAGLTPRQWEVVCALVDFPSTSEKQLANDLNVTPNTLHVHLRCIFRKAGVRSRGELVSLVRRGVTAIRMRSLIARAPASFRAAGEGGLAGLREAPEPRITVPAGTDRNRTMARASEGDAATVPAEECCVLAES